MRWLDLHTVYRWLAPCGGGAWLALADGAGRSVALLGSLGLLAAGLGALLLRGSTTYALTWRNRAAAWLMPWAHALGGGSLGALVVTSWLVWTSLAVVGAASVVSPWLAGAWLLDGAAAAWLVKLRIRHCHGRAQRRAVHSLLALLAGLAGAGLVAFLLGLPHLGAAIAGGPLAVLAIGYGLWVLLFVLARPRMN